jgi:uncharacterized membrane protein (UPF0127 family)
MERLLDSRLRRLPVVTALGREVPVATDVRSRLLGLAFLDIARVGPGFLIPRCSSVHTFGMRFPLDVYFLDEELSPLAIHREIPARRVVSHRGAGAVLEIPALEGGEFSSPRP